MARGAGERRPNADALDAGGRRSARWRPRRAPRCARRSISPALLVDDVERRHAAHQSVARTARGSAATPPRVIQVPMSVPQSSSRVMTSCATSTRRRVRYPESAVRSAVSARPLRAPWLEMKYSSTLIPSRRLLRIGRSMIRPDGSAMRPRMPASWWTWVTLPRAPEWVIIQTDPSRSSPSSIFSVTVSVVLRQTSTGLVVALVLGDEAAPELAIDLVHRGRPPRQAAPPSDSGTACRRC